MTALQADAFEWYIIDPKEKKPTGPLSLRDIEVMWETNTINNHTFAWKNGMPEWKRIGDIDELKSKIEEDTFVPILNKTSVPIPQPQQNPKITSKEPEKPKKTEDNMTVAEIHRLKMEKVNPATPTTEDPLDEIESLEKKFENLKKKFYKGEDGLWYVYHEDLNTWKPQAEDPNFTLGEDLLEDLIHNIDADGPAGGKKNNNPKKGAKAQDLVDIDTLTEEEIKKLEKNKKKLKKLAEKKKAKWYVSKKNTSIYVRGLPEDVTVNEAKLFFEKAGIIRLDPHSGEPKIKIYFDKNGVPKGDALISYAKDESIDLAMELLNNADFRPGKKVIIERAQFEQKGDNYVPRKKIQDDKITKLKLEADKKKMYSWNEDSDDEGGLKIVVLTKMFRPDEYEADPENFVENLKAEVLPECELLGPVHRIEIFENNPDGVIMVKFKQAASAEACIKKMNGRFFDGRTIDCFYYDGETDYRHVREDYEEEQKRLDDFGKWVDEGSSESEDEELKRELKHKK